MTESEFTSRLLEIKSSMSESDGYELCGHLIPLGLDNDYIGSDGESLCNELVSYLLKEFDKKYKLTYNYLDRSFNFLLNGFKVGYPTKYYQELTLTLVNLINRLYDYVDHKEIYRRLETVRSKAMECGVIIVID